MRVFISSVRRGLEAERDALPGLLLGLGHEPLRFEDFGALPMPSREACLRGVESADAYLVLLGEAYGDPLPDTGRSPTEEEWSVAKRRGIPILAFRKSGITPEPRQAALIASVEDYAEGRFRGAYSTVSELLVAAGRAIRALDTRPPMLVWQPLTSTVTVPWHPSRPGAWGNTSRTVLEVHVLPTLRQMIIPATDLANLGKHLARAGREAALFAEEQGLSVTVNEAGATAATGTGDHRDRAAGIRASSGGIVSIWQGLPSDMLGVLFDEADLRARIAVALRIVADLGLTSGEVAVGVGLRGLTMASIGSISELGHRTSASLQLVSGGDAALVEPTDTVSAAVLGRAADEIARELAARLLLRFGATQQ
ncbi:MAG: DUF4062 domain-containing protein [Solirubrobacterales bacterium]